MESDVFTEEVHGFRSFIEIFGSFFVLVVAFLYFVPDYFGIPYVNLGLSWNTVFIVASVFIPLGAASFGIHLFKLPKGFNKNHPYITSMLIAVNLFLLTVIAIAIVLLFIGITYFLLELIYMIVSSLLAHLSY